MWYKVKIVVAHHAGGAWTSKNVWVKSDTDDAVDVHHAAYAVLPTWELPISSEIVASLDIKPEEVVS